MPPRPPWAAPGLPPAAPSLPPVGFCFLLAPVAVGFFAFFGVPLVLLGSRVCVRGIRALYNAQGGRGRALGGWDGGWGHHLGTALPGRVRGHPIPMHVPAPLAFLWTKCGGSRAMEGDLGLHTSPSLSAPPPSPTCPPGRPTRPPHVTSRQVSSPQRDPRRGGGTGLPGPPWSPWPCPPSSSWPPAPPRPMPA